MRKWYVNGFTGYTFGDDYIVVWRDSPHLFIYERISYDHTSGNTHYYCKTKTLMVEYTDKFGEVHCEKCSSRGL